MQERSIDNFGLLIAYVVPGFLSLWGASYFVPTVQVWLHGTSVDSPTVGGFLYLTIASIAAGLTASTIRWAIIDTIHHRTGVQPPTWDFSLLHNSVEAFDLLVQIHYRYYQFYGNSLVALTFAYLARRASAGSWTPVMWLDAVFIIIAIVFVAGSRDALRKYYVRTAQVLHAVSRDRTTGSTTWAADTTDKVLHTLPSPFSGPRQSPLKLSHELGKRGVQGVADRPQLNHVESPLPPFTLAHKGLALPQRLGQFNLGNACLTSGLFEESQQDRVLVRKDAFFHSEPLPPVCQQGIVRNGIVQNGLSRTDRPFFEERDMTNGGGKGQEDKKTGNDSKSSVKGDSKPTESKQAK